MINRNHYFRVNLFISLALINLSNYAQSIETLLKVEKSNNDFIHIKHFLLGYCYHKLCLYEQAEKEYKTVIDLRPSFEDAYYNLAVLYQNLNDIPLSKRFLQVCLALNKSHSHAHLALSQLNRNLNWFSWWFGGSYKEVPKKTLGIILLVSFFSIIYDILFLNNNNINLTVILGFIIFLLVLPNVKSFSFGNNNIEISPVIYDFTLDMWDPYIPNDVEEKFKTI